MKKLLNLIKTAIDKLIHRNCDNDQCCGMCETAIDKAYEKTNIQLYEEKTNETKK
jgi:hypothetical protein